MTPKKSQNLLSVRILKYFRGKRLRDALVKTKRGLRVWRNKYFSRVKSDYSSRIQQKLLLCSRTQNLKINRTNETRVTSFFRAGIRHLPPRQQGMRVR